MRARLGALQAGAGELQDAQLQRRRADQRAVAAERISEELQQDLNSAEEQIRSLKAQLSQAVLVQGTAEVSAEGASKLVNELENSISAQATDQQAVLDELFCERMRREQMVQATQIKAIKFSAVLHRWIHGNWPCERTVGDGRRTPRAVRARAGAR